MAQLKDLLVSGVSRFVGKLFADEVQLTTLNIPTQSNGSTYGPGDSNGKNVLRSNGTSVYWGNLTIGDVSSGILPVTQGGTGLGTLTSGQALIGNGTGNVTFRAITNNTSATAVTASTNLITANTLYYHKGNSNLTTVGTISSGTWQGSTIGVKYGGTGHTDNWVQYGVVYASATNALTNTAAGTSGQLLKSNATSAPSWVSQADITAGKASALTNLTTGDAASSTATQRYVWISYDNNTTGRPAYTSALTFQTSTGTLTATKFAGDGASLTALNASNISSGTLSVDRLATSGVTAASYGPAANASPAHGASFTVPYITVDNKGRITAASTKTITLPSDNNTDVNVTQTNTTTNADYRILFSGNANDNNETTTVRKNTNLKYNPSTKNLQLTGGALTLGTSRINQAVTGTQVANGLDNGSSASPHRYTPAKWSFNLGFEPVTGDTVIIKTPGAGHDYGVFLSTDNGAHYHPITLNGTGRLSTHYPTGTYLQLTFDSANSATSVFDFAGSDNRVTVSGGTWRVLNYYDSNSTTINTLYEYYGNWVAGNNIKRYQVVFQQVGANHNKLITLFETDNAYGTTNKTLLTTEFDPCGKIYYYNSSAAVASGNAVAASALYWKVLLDMRYTFNISSNSASGTFTGTNGKQVYLRVNIDNTTGGASVDGNQPLVDVLPTTNDGKYYIYLGQMYSWYQMQLSYDHPVYYHNGKRIVEYKPIARVLDYNNSTPVEFGYSTSGMTGLTSSSWLAAWDAGTSGVYRLRAASPQVIRNAMGLGNTTGALPIANGGTAMTSNPSLLVNLASTDAATVFQASPRPGVTGKLPIAHGGTGADTAAGARTNLEVLRYINTTDITTWTADTLANTDSIAFTRGNITGAYTTGHMVWLNAHTIGTPFQLVIHDSSDLYLYKRWYSSGAWSTWQKIKAGYADSAGSASSATTATSAQHFDTNKTIALTGDTTGSASSNGASGWSIATETAKLSGINANGIAQSGTASRPTTANINYADNKLRYYLATSSMTTGKPSADGHIIHMPWDNGAWDVQLAVLNDKHIQIRGETGTNNTWSDWWTVLDSNNYTSYTVTKTGGGASGSWGISITGNATTATTANKLGTNAGSATQPVYFDGGIPKVATAYSGLLTAFSLSTNTLSLTVGGTTKTASVVSSVSNTWTGGTTSGPTIKTTVNGVAGSAVAIPSASASASGIITTGPQTIAGDKTFNSQMTVIGHNVIRSDTQGPDQGDILLGALGFKTGYPVYTDPTFLSGNNSIGVYNNTSGGNVVHTRDTYTNFGITSPGTNSNYVIRIQTKGAASPGIGGFVQSISSRINAVFIQIFRALIPVGRNVQTASNAMGTSYRDQWLTSQAGTGKWEWYARRVICGKEGTFSSGGHVYLDGAAGTSDAPVTWYLAACNVYDITRMEYDGLRTRYSDSATSATTATDANKLKYQTTVTTDADIDSFLEANRFKTTLWTTTSSPGVTNGVLLSGGYSNANYGFQLAIDDDPTYYIALRQKGNTNGWGAWKRIPMGDGTGASGTWGISISGNAATSTKLGTSNVGSTYVPIHLVAGTATQCSSPSLQVNLASTAADDVFKQSPRPGVTGVLGLANGGTGQTSAAGVFSALSWTGGTTAGPTLSATVVGQTRTATIPSASNTASGIITTDNQNLKGTKTLYDSNYVMYHSLDNAYNQGFQLRSRFDGADYGIGGLTATYAGGSTSGTCYLQLGTLNTAKTKCVSGLISIYSGTSYVELRAGGTRTVRSQFYFPNYDGYGYFTHTASDSQVGSGASPVYVAVNGRVTECTVAASTAKRYILGSSATSGNLTMNCNSSVYTEGSVLYGAAWNDYAEYREVKETIEPGRVVIENGDDTLSLSTERMQPGAEIVSDTFGFAIGETEKCKTPIAATGRVLAYPNEPRETYKPGQPVCSGPNGTVSQMTNEEAREYPWLIIGTVSAIPDYDTWGEDNIKVNGRIWVRIR